MTNSTERMYVHVHVYNICMYENQQQRGQRSAVAESKKKQHNNSSTTAVQLL